MSSAYLRFELMRTLRNRRVVIFSLAFPIVLYLLIAGPNRSEHNLSGTGISAPLYFMVGLAAFGTMNAVLSGPVGTLPGGQYTLGGGGDGYYYSTFVVGDLPAGDYVVTATRNGVEVAATGFRKSDG